MTSVSYVVGITGKKGTIKANTLTRAQEVKSVLSESHRGVYIKTVYTTVPEVCTSVMSEKRREMFRKKYLES
jgi:hypothetical protein